MRGTIEAVRVPVEVVRVSIGRESAYGSPENNRDSENNNAMKVLWKH